MNPQTFSLIWIENIPMQRSFGFGKRIKDVNIAGKLVSKIKKKKKT